MKEIAGEIDLDKQANRDPSSAVCLSVLRTHFALRIRSQKLDCNRCEMASLANEVHSLAKDIRAVTIADAGDQHDLGGMDEAQATGFIRDAFGIPLEGTEPVKVTFVIGAGKGGRQRYHPDLGRFLSTALRDLGYTEDRGASLCAECMGTFKSQHDTSKNLRFMHVFPRVAGVATTSGGAQGADSTAADGGGKMDGRSEGGHSLELLCASCEMSTFRDMVMDKAPSWSQRKKLTKSLQEMAEKFAEAEAKMIRMEALTPEENTLYDSSSAELMQEKIDWLTGLCKEMVESGGITNKERETLIKQVEGKLATVEADIAAAGATVPPRLQKARETLVARKQFLIQAQVCKHKLKHESELETLFRKLTAVEKLENTKGRLLTMAEVKSVGEKGELEEAISDAVNRSRGLFVDEEEFEASVAQIKSRVQARAKAASSGGGGGGGRPSGSAGGGMNMDGWQTVTSGNAKKKR